MAGAVTLEELTHIMEDAGFVDIEIDLVVVSDQYAAKWGLDVDLKKWLRNGTITARKI